MSVSSRSLSCLPVEARHSPHHAIVPVPRALRLIALSIAQIRKLLRSVRLAEAGDAEVDRSASPSLVSWARGRGGRRETHVAQSKKPSTESTLLELRPEMMTLMGSPRSESGRIC
jgi:hypothetical protein